MLCRRSQLPHGSEIMKMHQLFIYDSWNKEILKINNNLMLDHETAF